MRRIAPHPIRTIALLVDASIILAAIPFEDVQIQVYTIDLVLYLLFQ